MATWTNVPNSSIETDKPVRAVDIRALRDNPIAIAGGASGAPRIETNGIDDGAVTNAKLGNSSVSNAKLGNGSVSTAKIANSNVTTVKLESSERMTTGNVLGQTAGAGAGSVGTYAFAGNDIQFFSRIFGDTAAGSDLNPANAAGNLISGSLAGTWRCMGRSNGDTEGKSTLWLRIS